MSTSTTEQPPFPVKLDHFVICVRDLATSLPYYRTLLSLMGYAQDGEDAWTGGGLSVVLRKAGRGTADYDRHAPGLNHIGFAAAGLDDLERVQAAMRLAGFDAPEVQWFDEAVALFMKDPDGIRFEISAPAPPVTPPRQGATPTS